MANAYTKTHKRISQLKDPDNVQEVVGHDAGKWVTVIDRTDDDSPEIDLTKDYTVNGSRIAALNSAGVLYPSELPGAYGGIGHVIQGQMKSDGFYDSTGTKVTPSVEYVYLDTVTYDTHSIAYRWLSTESRYVVCPNTFRNVAGYGLEYEYDFTDPAHMVAWINPDIGPDILASNSADDPDSPGTKSLSTVATDGTGIERTIGYDVYTDPGTGITVNRLVHRAQDSLVGSTTRSFGPPDDSTYWDFGTAYQSAAVKVGTHVRWVTVRNVNMPDTLANQTPGVGIVSIASADDIKSPAENAVAGSTIGKAAPIDHVHASYALSLTGRPTGSTLLEFNLGKANKTLALSTFFLVTPPAVGPSVANTVFRTSADSIKSGAWGYMVTDLATYSISDVSGVTVSSCGSPYATTAKYSDGGTTKSMDGGSQANGAGTIALHSIGKVYIVSGELVATVNNKKEQPITVAVSLKMNAMSDNTAGSGNPGMTFAVDLSRDSTRKGFSFMYHDMEETAGHPWISITSEDPEVSVADNLSIALYHVSMREIS